MRLRLTSLIQLAIAAAVLGGFSLSMSAPAIADDATRTAVRQTPLVKAIQNCRRSVINIRGRKTVPDTNSADGKLKQVNGMGTGVVIDSRGYVLTNYHVVEGVRTINVTTYDREKTTAKLMAHDPSTDLAILKIETSNPLPPIKMGASGDLMLGEQVCAVGNAYGYEHTVTLGIVSALNRTVQVNEEQIYRNLIQTDAAINPGNSGGPLLNMYGEMIGINAAVRIGAQGIAFSIPSNDALDVAADLMAQILPNEARHGLSVSTVYVDHQPKLVVNSVSPGSPANKAGIKTGDQIYSVEGRKVVRELDFQSAMLNSSSFSKLRIGLVHGDDVSNVVVDLDGSGNASNVRQVAARSNNPAPANASAIAWDELGVMLTPVPDSELEGKHPNYKRGLRVTKVKRNSPADAEGIMPGDILVAMHGWKTESLENMAYILQRPEVKKRDSFMFYILRDKEPFWGQMRVANLPTR